MEINNCNCGGEGKVFVHTLPTTGREVYYYIYCDKCGIRTPSSQSMSEVLEVWNNAMERRYKVEYIPYETTTNTTAETSISYTRIL